MIPLLFLSMAILVPGIAESIPSTENATFQFFAEPDIVNDFTLILDRGVYSFTVSPDNKEESLLIQIPKNFPVLLSIEDGSCAVVFDAYF